MTALFVRAVFLSQFGYNQDYADTKDSTGDDTQF